VAFGKTPTGVAAGVAAFPVGSCCLWLYVLLAYTHTNCNNIQVIPCLNSPPKVLFIDDDENFVFALESVVPPRIPSQFVIHAHDVDLLLKDEADLLLREQQMFMAVVNGEHRVPLMAAADYFMWPGRKNIVSVLVSDHYMPAENGVSLCARHSHVGLQRLLLTGTPDSELAIDAFNAGSIEHFLPKQTDGMAVKLIEAVEIRHAASLQARSRLLREALSTDHGRSLSRLDVWSAVMGHLERADVTDFLVLDQPFGILGATPRGDLVWFAIEDDASLRELELVVQEATEFKVKPRDVRSAKLIPNLDLAAQVSGVEPTTSPGCPLGEGLYLAAFPFKVCT